MLLLQLLLLFFISVDFCFPLFEICLHYHTPKQRENVNYIDCKTDSFFFLQNQKKKSVKRGVIGKAWRARASHARIFSVSPQPRPLFSASFQIFSLTARAYLNT